MKIPLHSAELRCASTQLKSPLRSCAALQKIKHLKCASCTAFSVDEKIFALCCPALLLGKMLFVPISDGIEHNYNAFGITHNFYFKYYLTAFVYV